MLNAPAVPFLSLARIGLLGSLGLGLERFGAWMGLARVTAFCGLFLMIRSCHDFLLVSKNKNPRGFPRGPFVYRSFLPR